MYTQREQLSILQIEPSVYNSISTSQKKRLLTQQYRKLALKLHPDKNLENPNAAQVFQQLSSNYEKLLESLNTEQETILTIPESNVEFNLNDLSFFQQDAVLELYEKLLTKIQLEEDESNKQKIIEKNFEFLSLAKKIQINSTQINIKRAEAFGKYIMCSSPHELFYRRWRLFIVKTFTQEGLDDFSYRNALGTGDFSEIIAIEKLINPFKLLIASIVFIECGLYALFTSYNLKAQQFISSITSQNLKRFLQFAQVMFDAFIFINLLITSPLIFNFLLLSEVMIDTLEKIANPFNLIIKPIEKRFNFSREATIVSIILATLWAAITLIFLTELAPAFLLNILGLMVLYQLACFFYNIYQLSKEIFYFSVLNFIVNVFTIDFLGQAADIPSNIWLDIFSLCGNFLLIYKFNQMLSNTSRFQAEININLPLPQEKTNPEFIKIINDKHKVAFLSHNYFNTPKDALFETTDFESSFLEMALN